MRINKEKYMLARANACMGLKELVAAGIPRGTLAGIQRAKLGQKLQAALQKL